MAVKFKIRGIWDFEWKNHLKIIFKRWNHTKGIRCFFEKNWKINKILINRRYFKNFIFFHKSWFVKLKIKFTIWNVSSALKTIRWLFTHKRTCIIKKSCKIQIMWRFFSTSILMTTYISLYLCSIVMHNATHSFRIK